jgi:hypothetical protein
VGEVKTGLAVETKDDGKDDTGDTTAYGQNDDAGVGIRNRLTFGYAAGWGGAKIRLQSVDLGAVVPAYAYGWVNLLGSRIVVYGGKIGDDLWGTGQLPDKIIDKNFDNVNGVRVEIRPVAGLSVGFGLPFDPVTYGLTPAGFDESGIWTTDPDNIKVSVGALGESRNRTILDVLGGANIGGIYKADLFSAVANVRFNPAIYMETYGASKIPDPLNATNLKFLERETFVEILAGVEANPIAPLKVMFEVMHDTRKFNKDFNILESKVGFTRITLKGLYEIGPITAHLQGDIAIQNQSADKGDTTKTQLDGSAQDEKKFYIDRKNVTDKTYAYYVPVEKLGDMSFAFEVGGDYKLNDIFNAYLNIGSDNVAWLAGDINDKKGIQRPGNGLFVKPGVKIAIGGGSIEIFDKINGLGAADNEKYDGNTDKTTSYSSITNQFQIDFNWSF